MQLFSTPWSVTAVLATPTLVLFVAQLLAIHVSTTQLVVAVAIATAGAAIAVVACISVAFGTAAITLIAFTWLLTHFCATLTKNIVGAIVITLPLFVSCIFRNMRFVDLSGFAEKVAELTTRVLGTGFSWFSRKRVPRKRVQ